MAQAAFSCPCGAIHLESAQIRFPRRHKLRIPRSGHAGQTSLTSLLRLSPPRRRGGDPNAKPAPAPLHPKGTSAPTPWAWALLLSPPRAGRGGAPFGLAEKKTGRTRKGYAAAVSGRAANGCAIARSKRKERFWSQLCTYVQSCCTGVGVSVQAPIWAHLRARLGLLPGRYCRPVADGAEVIGVVVGWTSSSFRCRWPGGQGRPGVRALLDLAPPVNS